jgi:predicted NUDIX family NTP pyrophosphohydrolase
VPKRSAGLVLYRRGGSGIELLLVHPGGPFWARKDDGAWSVPKGEYTEDEDPEQAAVREFEEELGHPPPGGARLDLGVIAQGGGKRVQVFAAEGDLDEADICSNTFELEWPPRSGRTAVFPEVDRACWCTPEEARTKLLPGQVALVDRLLEALGVRPDD